MALDGGMSCVKYLLFCFNLLFAITGLVVLIVAIKAQIDTQPYANLTDEGFFTSAPVILMIIGVIVFIVAFFGCCGAIKENHCMVVTFAVFLLIIFLTELGVGIAGYMNHDQVENSIISSLNDTIKDYNTNKEVKNTFDIVQTDLNCCGINGPDDWMKNSLPIPDTCCTGQEIINGKPVECTPTSSNFHTEGCLNKVVAHLQSVAKILGAVGLGIATVQLLGVIFACCLARSIRSQYETV